MKICIFGASSAHIDDKYIEEVEKLGELLAVNMSERKRVMEDEAEAFIIVPGGIGTFEEFFEVLTLKQLGRHNKAIAVLNTDGYYDNLEKFMREVAERRFITPECHEMYRYFSSSEEIADYVENYVPDYTPWQKLKIGD